MAVLTTSAVTTFEWFMPEIVSLTIMLIDQTQKARTPQRSKGRGIGEQPSPQRAVRENATPAPAGVVTDTTIKTTSKERTRTDIHSKRNTAGKITGKITEEQQSTHETTTSLDPNILEGLLQDEHLSHHAEAIMTKLAQIKDTQKDR
jgi:hypothetical protein